MWIPKCTSQRDQQGAIGSANLQRDPCEIREVTLLDQLPCGGAGALLVWHKTDEAGGPPGRYLVDDRGAAVWLVDPGINGVHPRRLDGTEVRKFDAPKATLMSSLAVDPPAKMEMGSWIEFRPKDDGAPPRACKVLFVSPRKTRYLFSDRRGKDVIELSRAEIVRRLRSGEAVRLDEEPPEPLFERFMNGVVGKMKSSAKPATA